VLAVRAKITLTVAPTSVGNGIDACIIALPLNITPAAYAGNFDNLLESGFCTKVQRINNAGQQPITLEASGMPRNLIGFTKEQYAACKVGGLGEYSFSYNTGPGNALYIPIFVSTTSRATDATLACSVEYTCSYNCEFFGRNTTVLLAPT